MHILYDSESFSVLQLFGTDQPSHSSSLLVFEQATSQLKCDGFEIVDKRSGKEIFLNGAWAEAFHHQLQSLQAKGVYDDEIELVLDHYTQLAQLPVLVH